MAQRTFHDRTMNLKNKASEQGINTVLTVLNFNNAVDVNELEEKAGSKFVLYREHREHDAEKNHVPVVNHSKLCVKEISEIRYTTQVGFTDYLRMYCLCRRIQTCQGK